MQGIDRETLLKAFAAMSDQLAKSNTVGEVCVYGGATMVLAFNARLSTQDCDAVFKPAALVRDAAVEVARALGLREDWMNDGVKGWLSTTGRVTTDFLPQFSNLRLTRPTDRYLLAMKCLAARSAGLETQGDRSDIVFLVRALGLRTSEEILQLVEEFYPEQRIQPKTRFLIEEIMADLDGCDSV